MSIKNKFISILLFIISPLISFLFTIINYLKIKSDSHPRFLILITSIFLGLINSVKLIESDLILYQKQFELCEQLTYLEYIFLNIKDPAFYSYNYMFYHIISSDFNLYIFFLSVISYSFFLAAIFNFSNWIGLNYRLSILSLIVAALFPQIFSFSAHLLRQFFSVSVGFYALSLFFSGFKRKLAIIILFISCLIHSSNLLLFSLVFIGSPFKKLFKWSFLLIPVIIYLYSKISLDNPFLSGFARLNSINSGAAELNSVNIIVIFLCALLIIINLLINSKKNLSLNKIILDRFFYFINFLFFFFLIINNSEISNRLLLVIYFFWPILFSYFIYNLNMKNFFIFTTVLFFITIFSLNLNFGVWSYENLDVILFPLKIFLFN